jgi:hypothetical protein
VHDVLGTIPPRAHQRKRRNGSASRIREIWRIRINDFPDELMYSLMIGGENAGDFHFHDWPETWRRSDD